MCIDQNNSSEDSKLNKKNESPEERKRNERAKKTMKASKALNLDNSVDYSLLDLKMKTFVFYNDEIALQHNEPMGEINTETHSNQHS